LFAPLPDVPVLEQTEGYEAYERIAV
jgi:hypothetical protein